MPTVKQNRGAVLSFKLLLPERAYRALTLPVSWTLRQMPSGLLYKVGLKTRIQKCPYSVIKEGDVVVQIGAPRDLLSAGRSRAAYFMHLVGSRGKVVIFEPDRDSVNALRLFVERNGFQDRAKIIDKGAWSKDEELTFLSSPAHPAANLILGTEEISDSEMRRRRYQKFRVPVTTLDAVLERHELPVPKLVSITANGSEPEILKGMQRTIENGLQYISLAITGEKYPEMMADHGYGVVAYDDRGFTFEAKRAM